jgi:hypothetical protein
LRERDGWIWLSCVEPAFVKVTDFVDELFSGTEPNASVPADRKRRALAFERNVTHRAELAVAVDGQRARAERPLAVGVKYTYTVVARLPSPVKPGMDRRSGRTTLSEFTGGLVDAINEGDREKAGLARDAG